MSDEWVTDDLSLASFLSHNGHEAEPVWDGNVCSFKFKIEGDRLLQLVSSYASGEALVEPRRYNRTFAEMKAKMFNHPDAPNRRPRAGSRR